MNTHDLARVISSDAALLAAADIVRGAAVRGMRAGDVPQAPCGSLSVEYKRAAGVGCNLYVSFDAGSRTPVHERRRDADPIDHVWVQTPRVTITWSSTDRSVAAATAALALYREVLDVAALIEARLAEELIGFSEAAQSAAATKLVAK